MQHADEGATLLPVLLIAAAMAVYVALRVRGRVRARKQREARLSELERLTTEQWTRIASSGFVQAVTIGDVHLRPGELAVTVASSTLYEFRSAGGVTVGSRIKIAGVPLYAAQSVRSSARELREVGPGRLVLTNKRLLLIGAAHSLDVPLSSVTHVEPGFDTVKLAVSGRSTPLVLTVGNPVLLTLVMNGLISGSLAVRPAAPEAAAASA